MSKLDDLKEINGQFGVNPELDPRRYPTIVEPKPTLPIHVNPSGGDPKTEKEKGYSKS